MVKFDSLNMTEIQRFYNEKNVFITGGTGFIGKIIVEKLLRCTNIRKIFILIREKKGVEPNKRLETLFQSQLFDKLKEEKPQEWKKVFALQGDIEQPMLGLSQDSIDILVNEVEIVFHCAATVRFDEDLSRAIKMNIGSVASLVKLSKKMKRLLSLVHVSTAYCHCTQPHIKEQSYKSPMAPNDAIALLDNTELEILDSPKVTKEVIGERPNTYTFTKAIAEELVMTECQGMPVCIVRPSIVVSTWKDPMPGWVDNLNGPTGLFLIAGIGVMRTAVIHEDLLTDGVPVDAVSNLTIASAWNTYREYSMMNSAQIKIYNFTSGNSIPLTWGEIYALAEKHLFDNPLEGMVWYPEGSFKRSVSVNRIYEMVLHEFPAQVTDIIVRIFGRKPFAVRLCNKMQRGMKSLEYFTTHQWTWENQNVVQLEKSMDDTDREIFYFNLESLDWQNFILYYVLGTRHYVLKQDPKSIPACRRKLKFLWLCDRIIKIFVLYCIYKILVNMFL